MSTFSHEPQFNSLQFSYDTSLSWLESSPLYISSLRSRAIIIRSLMQAGLVGLLIEM